ncbi:hypothetical protein [Andreprevotia chitinilytica]|uniref:hypothetical protein n=1 Tax=Andreprevotia chitinilytica TaxID=396808 RepID=UPI0012EC2EE6|nr:hypothetical protein [Andreprevotia chitinilytica]
MNDLLNLGTTCCGWGKTGCAKESLRRAVLKILMYKTYIPVFCALSSLAFIRSPVLPKPAMWCGGILRNGRKAVLAAKRQLVAQISCCIAASNRHADHPLSGFSPSGWLKKTSVAVLARRANADSTRPYGK